LTFRQNRIALALAAISLVPAVCLIPQQSLAQTQAQAADSLQASIQTAPDAKTWLLSAGGMSYAVGINEEKMPQTLYWGPRLTGFAGLPPAKMHGAIASFEPPIGTTPLEYPAWGGGLGYEPALKGSFPNGNRSMTLVFDAAAQPTPDVLELTLRDTVEPIYVHLYYQVYGQGVLARWSTIDNQSKTTVTLDNAASATWNLPPDPLYQLSWLSGRWGGEWQLQQDSIRPGTQVLDSRRGSTSHQENPWFAIGEQGVTSETAGPVWFGELGWSGSWRIAVEEDEAHGVRLTGGYNPFDFSYPLAPGQSLTTPHFYGGYTAGGQGEASRILHHLQLQVIVPEAPKPKLRPVLFNSWEATGFDVTEAGQMALADRAAKLGVERFVIDDGWFGQRKTDNAGLGDWYVNPQKFPHGLKPVIDRVHQLGMDFGLWVEPEMVNPDSDLYRKHPDWAMHFPGRPRTEARNQLVLNLARPDVRAYVYGFLDKLVSENKIDFLKWDYNRYWSEPGWESMPLAQQQEIYVKYVENLYGILGELRKKHPGLEIESCSGGGGRVDDGILRYTDEVWPSDNTDALDRLTIQDGFTHAYAPGVMMAWVTDVPSGIDDRTTPLAFRFHVAMSGSLGIGGNLNRWTPQEMEQATAQVAYYKTIRPLVQQGDLYRLTPELATTGTWASEYVAPDKSEAVVFAFLQAQHYHSPFPTIRLEGLDPAATYTLSAQDPSKAPGLAAEATGAALMGSGIELNLNGDYDSAVIHLKKN
jgi:alpha-galactosidase